MADKKISALTSASTPLAGTEVFPLVQSGSTVKTPVSSVVTSGLTASFGAVTATASGVPAVLAVRDLDVGVVGDAGQTIALGAKSGTTPTAGADILGILEASATNGRFAVRTLTSGSMSSKLSISSAGDVTANLGNLVIGTAGKGIDFSANTHAAGMTSELLNWYETGTFTPAWGGSTTDPTNSYTSRAGRYTRIGDMVYCWVELVTSASSGGSGNLQIKGLPFAAKDGALSAGFASGFASNFPSGCFANSTTTVTMTATVAGVQQQYLGIATLGALSYLACTITYRIA